MTIQDWVPSIENLGRINRTDTFLEPKGVGGGFIYFSRTIYKAVKNI